MRVSCILPAHCSHVTCVLHVRLVCVCVCVCVFYVMRFCCSYVAFMLHSCCIFLFHGYCMHATRCMFALNIACLLPAAVICYINHTIESNGPHPSRIIQATHLQRALQFASATCYFIMQRTRDIHATSMQHTCNIHAAYTQQTSSSGAAYMQHAACLPQQ